MIQKTQGGITFSSYKDKGGVTVGAGPVRINGQQGPDEESGIGIINAVDIDWNGAQVDNNTINTTGEILRGF